MVSEVHTTCNAKPRTIDQLLKTIIFVNSHPIQYFAPMYKYMNEQGVKTKAWYCSDESVIGVRDNEFGVKVKWDVPILDGYECRFFKNYSWKPSHANGFFGLINLGMIKQLFKEPKSLVVVHGWHYCTLFLIILLGKLKGHTICLRSETPQKQEMLKTSWKQKAKKSCLKHIVFPRIHYFLFIGEQNYLFYKSYGLTEKRLIFCPYAIDNARFKAESKRFKTCLPRLKENMGIPADDKVILFVAKYIEKKNPIDLLRAFKQMATPNCWLIMVGEGGLRMEMEQFIERNKLEHVILTGFVNQSSIPAYYAISDVFVMCSGIGETWGLSVNEAMNFNLPLIVSDLTGCADNLVIDGQNGYVFPTGNVEELTEKLRQVIIERRLTWNITSESLIDKYSYSTILKNISEIL